MYRSGKQTWGCLDDEFSDRTIWKYLYIYVIIKLFDFFDTVSFAKNTNHKKNYFNGIYS